MSTFLDTLCDIPYILIISPRIYYHVFLNDFTYNIQSMAISSKKIYRYNIIFIDAS